MADIFRIPKELVGVGSPIACEVVETEEDLIIRWRWTCLKR